MYEKKINQKTIRQDCYVALQNMKPEGILLAWTNSYLYEFVHNPEHRMKYEQAMESKALIKTHVDNFSIDFKDGVVLTLLFIMIWPKQFSFSNLWVYCIYIYFLKNVHYRVYESTVAVVPALEFLCVLTSCYLAYYALLVLCFDYGV